MLVWSLHISSLLWKIESIKWTNISNITIYRWSILRQTTGLLLLRFGRVFCRALCPKILFRLDFYEALIIHQVRSKVDADMSWKTKVSFPNEVKISISFRWIGFPGANGRCGSFHWLTWWNYRFCLPRPWKVGQSMGRSSTFLFFYRDHLKASKPFTNQRFFLGKPEKCLLEW